MAVKRKVFVSYHHDNDQKYRDKFEALFHGEIMISKSVQMGDIKTDILDETIRQKIRDDYLSDSTVTVVLIGTQTWQRKHVDWEISTSIRETKNSSRSGLLGILLPTYPGYRDNKYNPYTIPPRLYYNIKCVFAKIYRWSEDATGVQRWIEAAYDRRYKIDPDNSFPIYQRNHWADSWEYLSDE